MGPVRVLEVIRVWQLLRYQAVRCEVRCPAPATSRVSTSASTKPKPRNVTFTDIAIEDRGDLITEFEPPAAANFSQHRHELSRAFDQRALNVPSPGVGHLQHQCVGNG